MAWTDSLRIAITPLPTVATHDFETELIKCIRTDEITEIVFGLPAHKDGNLTNVGIVVKKLVDDLSVKYDKIKFHLVDESFTSFRASRLLVQLGVKKKKRQEKGTLDQMSAVVILKEFLNYV